MPHRRSPQRSPLYRAAKERAIRRLPVHAGRWVFAFAIALAISPALPGSFVRALSAQNALPSSSATGEVSPPDIIAGLRDARPSVPLEFSRAWLKKVDEVRRHRAELTASGELDGMSPWQALERGAALAGTLRVPVIPILYNDVAPPFPVQALHERLFGNSQGDTLSYSAYWNEVSSGLLQVEGQVTDWIRLGHPARHYLPESYYGWAQFGRTPELRVEALRAADMTLDFAQFDNDGPDGIPNSGDDDGFVDFVALVYALPCPGTARAGAIWPHRAAMPPLETNDASANGGKIKIADYVILPAVDAQTCGPMHVGVLAHETGHALGLPDLYDYDGSTQGIGAWGLMGTGSHSARYSPAHLSAWEKEQLGWVRLSWLRAGKTLSLPPVQRDPEVYRYDIPNSAGEYLLFENRQRVGSDKKLPGHGMLVWRVDPERGELGAWNNDERRPAVGLIEADGRGDLARGGRADATDPYPGALSRQLFRLPDVQSLRLSFIHERDGVIHATPVIGYNGPTVMPQRTNVNLTALVGQAAAEHTLALRTIGDVGPIHVQSEAKWLKAEAHNDSLRITADPWGLPPGAYQDTLVITAGRDVATHVVVDLQVALPGVPEIVAQDLPWSWGLAARSGRVLQASYGWDALGLRPRPRVLQLWDGTHHPETLARIPADALYAPALLDDHTAYVIAHARNSNYLYRLDSDGGARVVAANIGSGPAYGTAVMPNGDIVVAEWSGKLHRVTPEGDVSRYAELKANIYQVTADADGVIYAASLDGNVIRLSPDGTIAIIQTGFAKGKLVAVALSHTGELYVAERGDQGRIYRINDDGTRHLMLQNRAAQFYGLAVDEHFLYAIDMRHRELLRIPMHAAPSLVARTP